MNREQIFEQLSTNPALDVLIVGGGINGAGTFHDLALQGLNVLLVDKNDFCSGTSAASSHMAHGGIRYLENGEFRLVREAVTERNRLLKNAPHYVSPLPTVIPIFRWFSGIFNAPLKFLGVLNKPAERGAAIVKAGLMMYDAYTGAERTVPRHKLRLRQASLKAYPQLNPDIICTATYYDALIRSPERLCVELILDSEKKSPLAHALNYVAVDSASGSTVRLRDETTDEVIDISPRVVVNAAGPWIDLANAALGKKTNFIGGTKGSHLVVAHDSLRQAVGEHEFFFENDDGRIVLLCPLMDRVLVGTSDIPIDNPEDAVCTEEEVDYFLEMIDKVFPGMHVDRSHIVFTFSGVRPLPATDANTTGQISRDHSIELLDPDSAIEFPIYNLIGGKWTTFRALGEQAADQVLRRLGQSRQCNTADIPIGGGHLYPASAAERENWIDHQVQKSKIARDKVERLFDRYGTHAQRVIDCILEANQPDQALTTKPDYSILEITSLVKHEKVVHIDDILRRRSDLAMLGSVSEPLVEEIAGQLAALLDWTDEVKEAEIQRGLSYLPYKYCLNHDRAEVSEA